MFLRHRSKTPLLELLFWTLLWKPRNTHLQPFNKDLATTYNTLATPCMTRTSNLVELISSSVMQWSSSVWNKHRERDGERERDWETRERERGGEKRERERERERGERERERAKKSKWTHLVCVKPEQNRFTIVLDDSSTLTRVFDDSIVLI